MAILHFALVCATALADDKPVRWTFEDAGADKLPAGWAADKTGKGEGSVWKIVKDETAPAGPQVLAQTSSDGPNPLFNLCVCDEASLTDVELSVSYKAVTGKKDQGGGLMWRYKDAGNYYIARENPLEGNLRVYRVVGGKRAQLATADVTPAAGKWHMLRIVHRGDHIQCYLDDKLHLDVKDTTFKDAGKVGLWTKADAVTYFDDLKIAKPSE
jgi:hypothetical protein